MFGGWGSSRGPSGMATYRRVYGTTLPYLIAFYPRDAMRKRGLCCRKMAAWLAGCPSHAGIVSKRLNLS